MQLSIEKKALLTLLIHSNPIVEKKPSFTGTLPALSHILLIAENDKLSIEATDLDITLNEWQMAHVTESGIAVVPAYPFYEIVRKLQDGEVHLKHVKNKLTLTAENVQFQLQTIDEGEFPKESDSKYDHTFTLESNQLKKAIEITRTYMSTDETRYALNGIFIHTIQNSYVRFIATDGHRLAYTEIYIPELQNQTLKKGIILPRKTCQELLAILNNEANVTVKISDRRIHFVFDNIALTSKLVGGEYVEYQQIIPKDNHNNLHINTQQLASSVDRVTSITTDKIRTVKLALSDGEVVMSSMSEQYGTGQEKLAVTYEGDPLKIGFNARYILELCANTGAEKLRLSFLDTSSAAVITNPEDEHTIYIIMPMRI